MNIAMISYHTCPLAILGGKDTGGMNVYVHELTRFLGMQHIHVDVFTRSQDEHVPQVSHDLGFGNRVVHVPAGPQFSLPKPELAQYTDAFADFVIKFAACKGIAYDVIHGHYWLSGLVAERLKQNWQIPMIQMFHTLGLMKQQAGRTDEEREGEYRILGEKQVMAVADGIIAPTGAEVDQLKRLYGVDEEKISIIPPGVDVGRFYPIPKDEAKAQIGIPEQDRMVLFVGRIEPLKGIDTLLQAMAIIRSNCDYDLCPHYLAIIGGEPDANEKQLNNEMSRLQGLCKQLGIEDMVLFLGKQGQDTLAYYYSAAEILVMPSHYESFGMVALEAMACGTPVIASQVGGLACLVRDGETGFSIPSQNAQILSEKMRILLIDRKLREQMGNQAAEYAKQYQWETIAQRMIKVYQQAGAKPAQL